MVTSPPDMERRCSTLNAVMRVRRAGDAQGVPVQRLTIDEIISSMSKSFIQLSQIMR